jgi:sugar phosphate isomerase/epimerase
MTDITWTLSGFGDEIDPDPDVQIAVLQALGANHIEIRSAWNTNIVDMSPAQLDAYAKILADRGMGVSAIASPIGKVDIASPADAEIARLERAIVAAQHFGARYIRIFSFYRAAGVTTDDIRDEVITRMRDWADLAARNDIVLVHENEKDIYGDVPARVLDIVESIGSPALRVAWDNANYVQCGVRPYDDGYRMLRPYLEYLQVKDAVASTGDVVEAGHGDGQLVETLTSLRDDGYTGFASLEPHLAIQHGLGGFSGPAAFGRAARAFATLTDAIGVNLA